MKPERAGRSGGFWGVEFAVGDAHEKLEKALRVRFPGYIWSRCQAHFQRNVLGRVLPPIATTR
ncbi:transposase [Salinibacter ruber]|uniref:transposase n=1 Tax=Salinibacter ruber TaxID=146919 RepID=UPI003C6E7836